MRNRQILLIAVAFTALAGAPRIALAGEGVGNTDAAAVALAILVPVLAASGAMAGCIVWRRRAERRAARVPAVTPASTPPPDTTPVFRYTRRPRPHSASYVIH